MKLFQNVAQAGKTVRDLMRNRVHLATDRISTAASGSAARVGNRSVFRPQARKAVRSVSYIEEIVGRNAGDVERADDDRRNCRAPATQATCDAWVVGVGSTALAGKSRLPKSCYSWRTFAAYKRSRPTPNRHEGRIRMQTIPAATGSRTRTAVATRERHLRQLDARRQKSKKLLKLITHRSGAVNALARVRRDSWAALNMRLTGGC